MASPAHASLGDFGKQTFNQIQPTGAGGREMNVIAGVAFQLGLHLIHLVRGVIVHDQMHIGSGRKIGLNFVEKLQEPGRNRCHRRHANRWDGHRAYCGGTKTTSLFR